MPTIDLYLLAAAPVLFLLVWALRRHRARRAEQLRLKLKGKLGPALDRILNPDRDRFIP